LSAVTDIQTALDAALGTVEGLTVSKGVPTLWQPLKNLPGCGSYFVGFDSTDESTQSVTRTARFEVIIHFSLADGEGFKEAIATIVPGIHTALYADRDLGGKADTLSIEDGGPAEYPEDPSVRIAVKSLFVLVEFEEAA